MWRLYLLYTLNRPYYRPIGVPPKSEGDNVVNINETIDASAFERWRTDTSYRQPGLQSWAKAKSVDPAKITTTVRANDPSAVAADPAEGGTLRPSSQHVAPPKTIDFKAYLTIRRL